MRSTRGQTSAQIEGRLEHKLRDDLSSRVESTLGLKSSADLSSNRGRLELNSSTDLSPSSELKTAVEFRFQGAICEKVKSLWPGASQWRSYYHRMWCQLSTTWSNVLKQPNGELLVAINHNQLRTMASETLDPIDWSHPPPSWGVSLSATCIV